MIGIVGTVPEKDFPLSFGEVCSEGDRIIINDRKLTVNRGTPALLAALIKTCIEFGQPSPFAYLVGDIGLGDGSRRLYEHLSKSLGRSDFKVLTFHYLQPDVDWHNHLLFAIEDMTKKPVLIADAGFMYAAKMSGQAESYDLFTPDVGELAFLADEEAPHPFYTKGFILHDEKKVPELISRAYKYQNSAKYLLVKGEMDYIANSEGIIETINEPSEEAMEAIGGTGDTLTGIVTGLIGAGYSIQEAAILGAKVNRLAGHLAKPTPATQVIEIVSYIPDALKMVL